MKTDAKHTPGPYTVIKTHRGVPVVTCQGPTGGTIARCDTNKPPEENEANARMLSAAPELLELARRVNHLADLVREHSIGDIGLRLDLMELDHIYGRPAIAKADGEAP